MTDSLALRWRPRRFADVSGQGPVTGVLYAMARRQSVPYALLLAGCRGSGKTTTARILAAALNCEQAPGTPDQWPCTSCPSCKAIANDTSLDVLEVDAASNGGVAEIRKIKDLVQYAATAPYRVVLLDEAHSMSRDAFNALLKVLEEPPPRTVFVLLTTEPGKILATVASRCMTFLFRRLPPAVIAARLAQICQAEGFAAEPALLADIAGHADGAMRDAIMSLDQVSRVGITSLSLYRQLMGESDFAPGLVGAMVAGDHAQIFARLDAVLTENGDYALVAARLAGCLRDLLVLQSGGQVSAQDDALEARSLLARRLDAQRVTAAMRVLWDLKTRAGRTEPRSSLELAVVLCAERLQAPRRAAAPYSSSNGNGRMTGAELASMTAGAVIR